MSAAQHGLVGRAIRRCKSRTISSSIERQVISVEELYQVFPPAQDLAREVQEAGGILTAGDLRSAQPYLRPALRVKASFLSYKSGRTSSEGTVQLSWLRTVQQLSCTSNSMHYLGALGMAVFVAYRGNLDCCASSVEGEEGEGCLLPESSNTLVVLIISRFMELRLWAPLPRLPPQ